MGIGRGANTLISICYDPFEQTYEFPQFSTSDTLSRRKGVIKR